MALATSTRASAVIMSRRQQIGTFGGNYGVNEGFFVRNDFELAPVFAGA